MQQTKSILEAIQEGNWDYEPSDQFSDEYDSTEAMPGSDDKLSILAQRVEEGLPLWHPSDRLTYDGTTELD